MNHSMINARFEQYRSETALLLKDIHALVADLRNDELTAIISELRAHIGEPFLFVVVGEIKAGKSSFINALLGSAVCKVDPAPCTDVVQEIVYAPEAAETALSPLLRRIGLPVEILKQIAIVDTPGTNTVIAHHQEITQRFIPNSGLVLFVFPAKNPHTLTAWRLLEFVSDEWKRRVVFVLQQADLATAEELRVNREKVAEYAAARGIERPTIFQTSARREIDTGDDPGFAAVRDYIRQTVTDNRHYYLKLVAAMDSAEQVLKKIYDAVVQMKAALDEDEATAGRIRRLMEEGKAGLDRDTRYFVDRLLEQYDRVAIQTKREFESGLGVWALYKRALGATVSRRHSIETWLSALQERFSDRLGIAFEDQIGEGARQMVATLRDIAERIVDELQAVDLSRDREAFQTIDIGEKREDVVSDIRRRVKELAETDFVSGTLAANPGSLPSKLVSGSAITLVGAMLLGAHISIVAIAGGVLTGLGVLMAGGYLMVKKGQVIRQFNQALLEGRQRFEEQVAGRIRATFDTATEAIHRRVEPFYTSIAERRKRLEPLADRGKDLDARAKDLRARIQEMA